jgi:CDP-diacylglycerol--glycerol-3-phosphate 3-phosphatidyltransferase
MINISNILSSLRGPLAFAFLSSDTTLRCFAIIAAMITDCLDGYFARRFRNSSQLGAVLDPLMDKFFVVFALTVFVLEGQLSPLSMCAMLCRDFAVILFGLYLHVTGDWVRYQFRAIWCGKVTTALQFFVLLALTFHESVPGWFFSLFVVLGAFALIELSVMAKSTKQQVHADQ